VIAYHEVGRGTVDTVVVQPREIFQTALLANAAALIVGHYVPRNIMPIMLRRRLCGRSDGRDEIAQGNSSLRPHNR
jgi:DNA repair protein RadC